MLLGMLAITTPSASDVPALHFERREAHEQFGVPFAKAVDNLLRINTVPSDATKYNSTGRMQGSTFIRAGGDYHQPWTRDAAVNSWNAASLFAPDLARDTLWAVTVPSSDGPIVQRDNQWWDKVVWIVGAWNHYLVTGDKPFLRDAFGVSSRLIREMELTRFNKKFGLFEGPSFFNDGIAGYPSPPADPKDEGSSFVLDHPGSEKLMALSTNCLYVGAYDALSSMARELEQPHTDADASAADLKKRIDQTYWNPKSGLYDYLLYPDGHRDSSQEGCGLSFSILFGVASPARAKSILKNTHLEPFGITDVYPHFERFSDARPGRHNAIVWPMVQGMWARAAAQVRDRDAFQSELANLARLSKGSDGRFFEIYNAKTGAVDGGWQNGHQWDSVPDQTWSATAYISMITNGLFGMRFSPKGLEFQPLVPEGLGDVTLTGVRYRGAILHITLKGSGSHLRGLWVDGKLAKLVSPRLDGIHEVVVQAR